MKNGLIIKKGAKCWYFKDKFHRTDGPAIEWADGTKEWYVHGKRHRIDGPAIDWVDGTSWWYFEDRRLGDDQVGFWALWALLTPDEQCNVNLLQWWSKYTAVSNEERSDC